MEYEQDSLLEKQPRGSIKTKIIVIVAVIAALACILLAVSGRFSIFKLLFKSSESKNIGAGTGNRIDAALVPQMTKPVFSDIGGFYTGRIAITITSPQLLEDVKTIRVTYDGSEPTAQSPEYNGKSIIFPDAGCVSTDFSSEDQNVSVSILRAACFDKRGNIVGQISTATYIQVSSDQKGATGRNTQNAQPDQANLSDGASSRFNMPVVSLVTDGSNLNNIYDGIFANPDGKGSAWERPVNVAFYEPDGTLAFTQDAGMRLFGGSSRTLAQKSLRITARKSKDFNTDIYDGAGKFKYALFPGRMDANGKLLEMYDSFVLRNGGNDSILLPEDSMRITYMRDGLAALITQKAAPNVDAMAYRPVVVFINGEYYGIMNMREYQDKKYIQNVYGISDENEDNITVISTELNTSYGDRYDGTWFYYKQDSGPEGELDRFRTLLVNIVEYGTYTYDEAAQLIDMDNFMKYCALNLFMCNTDWPHNNIKVWRYAGEASNQVVQTDQSDSQTVNAAAGVTDGKWRFMLKDVDLGMGRYVCGAQGWYPVELYTESDSQNIRFMLSEYMDFPYKSGFPICDGPYYPDELYIKGLFYFCMQNKGFADSFVQFCEKLVYELWTPEALENIIIESTNKIEGEMENFLNKNFGQWQWNATTDIISWKSASVGSYASLVTWAHERSGELGEFIRQVYEVAYLFEMLRG